MTIPAELAAASEAPLWNAWMAAFHFPTVVLADEFGLFAMLCDGGRTAAELAQEARIELRASEAIVGLLAALGFLTLADGRFCLTDTARAYLLPDSPFYWGGMLRRFRAKPIDCKQLSDLLRREHDAAATRLTGIWQPNKPPPPEVLVAFTHAMHAHSFALATRAVRSFGLDGALGLLDVAGGSGSYSIAAALRHPGLRCTVLDLEPVCATAREYADSYGVGDRIATLPADMFTAEWPSGPDRILLADIFHDWDDERCAILAERAHQVLPPGGKLMLHEKLLADAKDGPAEAMAYSLMMVLVTEGRQRSGAELRALLERAGFVDVSITPSSNGYAVVSGSKP